MEKKGLIIFIVILSVFLITLSGYVVYDKFIKKDQELKTNENNSNKNNEQNETNINSSKDNEPLSFIEFSNDCSEAEKKTECTRYLQIYSEKVKVTAVAKPYEDSQDNYKTKHYFATLKINDKLIQGSETDSCEYMYIYAYDSYDVMSVGAYCDNYNGAISRMIVLHQNKIYYFDDFDKI